MEYIEGVEKWRIIANICSDTKYEQLQNSAVGMFNNMSDEEKLDLLSVDDIDPTQKEYEGIFDETREIYRIAKYMCEKEKAKMLEAPQ